MSLNTIDRIPTDSKNTTFAPSFIQRNAMALPIPVVLPVTMMTLSFKRIMKQSCR